ncbi:DUF362 domain-containing protein [Candidatus Saganbacteria bacterium]|nr:DUF362 domain-containing protein [Candidatus Saganbacteria bacterium]
MTARVAIVRCQTYDPAEVAEAIAAGLELLGGLQSIIPANEKVLLKVNALMEAAPDATITTHPSIVETLTKILKNNQDEVFIGDSPGNPAANIARLMEKTGFKTVAENSGAKILNFHQLPTREVNSPSKNCTIKTLRLSAAAFDYPNIISLAKLKTHGWTLYTGAIKNLFGLIPGFHKSQYHLKAPQPRPFSQMLVDIFEIVKPKLNIIDAVYGMEGDGPSAGQKRFMGAILLSTDAVALDAVGAQAIGYQPFDIDMIKIAHERGLGCGKLDEIEIVGLTLKDIARPDWRHASSAHNITRLIPPWLTFMLNPLKNLLRVDPVIDQTKCRRCLICFRSCPNKAITNDGQVTINQKLCIMCYCCHELCPYKAIDLKSSPLARLMGVGPAA